jgi:glycosyltransferase involved in cell wall biosynthesis
MTASFGLYNRYNTMQRIAVLCDLLEEQWPSMDLVGEMLSEHLTQLYSPSTVITQLRPPMNRRISTSSGSRSHGAAFTADRLINRFWDYPRWLRSKRDEFDVFHLADHSYSQLVHELPSNRVVITCHDLDTFRCILQPELEPRSPLFRAMAQRILEGFSKAARIICVSQRIYDQVVEHNLAPSSRLTVIHNGVHPSCNAEPHPIADVEATRLLGPIDESTPLLLHVGSVVPRKRIDVLLTVFEAVRRLHPNTRLIRVGGQFTSEQHRLMEYLGLTECTTVLPFLNRETLAAVYRRAAVVVQTSEREGFGLPVAEAMSCGVPVIASDIPVLREVGGKAAVYCPVSDLQAWTDAIVSLLEERNICRDRLARRREKCLAHAAKFSWRDHAEKVFTIYQEL